MSGPLVSIVIPVYNGSNFLREALDSALAQTWPHCEVLVVNDGSTDGGATETLALTYGDRIRYFHKENGGVASALNLGIREMRGEFFSWLSHDDVYLPDKCRLQMEFRQQCNDARVILYSDSAIIDARGKMIGKYLMPEMTKDEAMYRIWSSSFLNGCTMLIPRLLLLEAGGFNEALPTTQDYDLWLRLAQKATFRHCPGIVLLSRQHLAQGSRSKAHRRECAELFSRFVPQLLQHIRKQEGGFAEAAPVLARGIFRRTGVYGIAAAASLYRAFKEQARPEEKKLLALSLLRQLPYSTLRGVWLSLPLSLRGPLSRLFIWNSRLWGTFRRAVREDGWRMACSRAIYCLLRVGDRWRRIISAVPARPGRRPWPVKRPLQVVVDHDSGGGAVAFREQYVSKLLARGCDVLVWQYLNGAGNYHFEWCSAKAGKTFRASTLERAADFVRAAEPEAVFFNNLVGWPRLSETLDVLASLKASGAALDVFLHDYFVICPVFTLLNRKWLFCEVPTPPSPCLPCLAGHPLVAPHDSMDIAAWRDRWSHFLKQADRISVPDSSGLELFAKGYPQLADKIRVAPLEPLQSWRPLPPPSREAPVVVGVIGHITRPKGAGIVEDLIRLISAEGLDLRVVVVGTLKSRLRHPRLRVTGAYRHSRLPGILQKHGVTVGLVPSVCPETFCYVAQEIEMLGLPLVCLDLGAQGARAHRYAKGFPAPTPDAAGCLEAILRAEKVLRTEGRVA